MTNRTDELREFKFRAVLNEEALSNGRYAHTNKVQEFTLGDVIRGKFTLVYPEHWKITSIEDTVSKSSLREWIRNKTLLPNPDVEQTPASRRYIVYHNEVLDDLLAFIDNK